MSAVYYRNARLSTDVYPEVLPVARKSLIQMVEDAVERDGMVMVAEVRVAQRIEEVPAGIDDDGEHYDAYSVYVLTASVFADEPVS